MEFIIGMITAWVILATIAAIGFNLGWGDSLWFQGILSLPVFVPFFIFAFILFWCKEWKYQYECAKRRRKKRKERNHDHR